MTFKHAALFFAAASLSALTGSVSCSSTFEPKVCATDDDCGGTLVCVAAAGTTRQCVVASSAPIRIGQSAVASGPNGDLGQEMRRGVQLAFDDQNHQGGVHGRPLELNFLDDQYVAALAESNARKLVDAVPGTGTPRCPTTQKPPVAGQAGFSDTALLPGPNAVSAVIGSVGTPTMVRAAPIVVETGTLYFGAFTGATAMLRDTQAMQCDKYIFNIRASYAQEARATLEFFFALKVPDDKHLISFDQNDAFGDAGFKGLHDAYVALRSTEPTISRYRYDSTDTTGVGTQVTAVTGYLAGLLSGDTAQHTVGILMTDTYGPANTFIQGIKNWIYANDSQQSTLQKATRLQVYFSNVSFVGPNTLADRLVTAGSVTTPTGSQPYTSGVFVSQVVPNYDSDSSQVVLDYKRLLAPTGASPTFTALEGYIVGRVFVEGLKQVKGVISADTMIPAFENLSVGALGLGASAGFSSTKHQYSQTVYGTEIGPDRKFVNRYFWSDGSPIQLFQ